MKLSRDVILDLLPLYLSGEASADTHALVKERLESDPDLAWLARQWQERMQSPAPSPANPESQALAYREAKRKIQQRTLVIAALCAAGVLMLVLLLGGLFLTVG